MEVKRSLHVEQVSLGNKVLTLDVADINLLENYSHSFIFQRVAIEFAKGLEDNPLTAVTWLVEPPDSQTTSHEEKVPDVKVGGKDN